MRYVIAYDVSDNARRARVAKRMESVGERVQGSVFEADLDDKTRARLEQQLTRVINPQEDSVRFYRLCGDCAGEVRYVGQARIVPPPPSVIIV
jgi:CRISPR-associated protein Cas2